MIPEPLNVASDTGQLRVRHGVRVESTEAALEPIVDRFRRDVARRTGIRLEAIQTVRGAPADDVPSICIELGGSGDFNALPAPIGISPRGEVAQSEHYSLTIGPDRIVVRAAEAVGAARGLTTLVQLLATTPLSADGAVVLHAVHIRDAPRFAWRGLHLDVVRTFFTVQEVKRVIDLLALYKLSRKCRPKRLRDHRAFGSIHLGSFCEERRRVHCVRLAAASRTTVGTQCWRQSWPCAAASPSPRI